MACEWQRIQFIHVDGAKLKMAESNERVTKTRCNADNILFHPNLIFISQRKGNFIA